MNVTAAIKFLGPVTGRPKFHGVSREKDNFPLVEYRVEIADARAFETPPRLDVDGYMFTKGVSPVLITDDLDEVKASNQEQATALLRGITGARIVVPFHSVIRRSERSPRFLKDGTTVPARFVHNDFGAGETEVRRWVDRILGDLGLGAIHDARIATYNTWRPLTPPPTDVPLALCDVRTLGPDDRVAVECVEELPESSNWVFEMSAFRYSSSQRWAYVPNMTDDELLIFKGFDNDLSRAALTPHVAFTAPDCPENAPARTSIESRFLAVF